MDQVTESQPKKSRKWLIGVIIAAIVVIAVVLVLLRSNEDTWIKDSAGNWAKHGNPSSEAPESSSSVTIPAKVLQNKFGFLGGAADDSGEGIVARGVQWVRPHPGAFVWDAMQKSATDEISFESSDQEIQNYQKNNLGILATIWPFADWDQQKLANASACKVSPSDEFLKTNDKKGRGAYLPLYRCNPSDWAAYQKYVAAIVERYDGDGTDDMPGLKQPVKYWEAMNEPDLQYDTKNQPAGEGDRLNFYKLGPTDYGQLLKYTYEAIKKADSGAQVLIAGAAGGDETKLNFYDTLFSKMPEAPNYFDIGNIHCISNDQKTSDFNVSPYKALLTKYGITQKPIWVTEAEAMYGKTAEQNYEATKKSTAGAITAGAARIFYTRDNFADTRTDMSQKSNESEESNTDSEQKFQTIISQY